MSYTSTAVKNRYNKKTYDQLNLHLKKGQKEILKEKAEAEGLSVTAYIKKCTGLED